MTPSDQIPEGGERKPSEILSAAADLIEQPGKWTQGAFARNRHGFSVLSRDCDAVCFCAAGAIYNVSGTMTKARVGGLIDRVSALARQHGAATIAQFNDRAGRTADEVADLLRKAAEKAREKGQ